MSNRLSERGKKVLVRTKSGAHFHNIQAEVENVIRERIVCTECIREIVVISGGNDTQNCHSNEDELKLRNSFITLLHYINSCLPSVKTNVFSLIPRLAADPCHISRMMHVNDFLMHTCNQFNCTFIDVFTNFLTYSRQFINHGIMILNRKLFSPRDMIHLNDIGTSVLAKIIIGVLYRPFPR